MKQAKLELLCSLAMSIPDDPFIICIRYAMGGGDVSPQLLLNALRDAGFEVELDQRKLSVSVTVNGSNGIVAYGAGPTWGEAILLAALGYLVERKEGRRKPEPKPAPVRESFFDRLLRPFRG